MTQEYDNNNRGSLFLNDKDGNEKRPDYKGSINVKGVDYWLSGWKKRIEQGKKAGQTMLSLSIQEKEVQPQTPQQPQTPVGGGDPNFPQDEEDLPF